jgi:hypothetical protein
VVITRNNTSTHALGWRKEIRIDIQTEQTTRWLDPIDERCVNMKSMKSTQALIRAATPTVESCTLLLISYFEYPQCARKKHPIT